MREKTPMEKIVDATDFKQQCIKKGYQLQSIDFSKAELCKALLCGSADHPELTLTNPRFMETDLRLAHCVNWRCKQARFERSDCTGTRFYGCNFVEVEFKAVTYFDPDSPVFPAKFVGSELNFADFEGEDLQHVVFVNCVLRGANFKDCDLRYARFVDCDLAGANFTHASIDGINLHGSQLEAGQLKTAEADDWTTVCVQETGQSLAALRDTV